VHTQAASCQITQRRMEAIAEGGAAQQIALDEAKMGECLREGDPARVLAVLHSAQQANVRMINMSFTALVETGTSVDAASVQVLQLCEKHSVRPSQALYNNVLATLSKRGPPEAVIAWVARMRESNGISVDRVATNTQLKALSAMGDVKSAVALLTQMMKEQNGHPSPDAVSFNTVIAALSRAQQPEKAETLLNAMADLGLIEAGVMSFTGVITGYARASKPIEATRLLQRMLSSGIVPDTVAFNAVLLAYTQGDCNVSEAKHVLDMLERVALDECPKAKPDTVSYNTFLSVCARAKRPSEAEKAFASMQSRGIKPDQVTFSTIINAHAVCSDTSAAQDWLQRMESYGIAPDAQTFNTVCSAHARQGDAVAALGCLDAMRVAGVDASPTTHAIMVNALIKAGRTEQAEAGLRQLVNTSERLTASSFNALIAAHAKHLDRPRAEAVFALMLEAKVAPTLATFNSLGSAYANNGDTAGVERTMLQAKGRGFALDRYSYGALLQSCIKAREQGDSLAPRKAREHIEALLASGVPLNDHLSNAAKRAVGDQVFSQIIAQRHGSSYSLRGGGSAPPLHSTRERPAPPSSTRPRTNPNGSTCQYSALGTAPELRPPPGLGLPPSRKPASGRRSSPPSSRAGEDGWKTVAKPSRNGRLGSAIKKDASPYKQRHKSPPLRQPAANLFAQLDEDSDPEEAASAPTAEVASPTAPIAAPKGAPTSAPAASSLSPMEPEPSTPPTVRLSGVMMTRSKSDRSRLLALAQDVVASGATADTPLPPSATARPSGAEATPPLPRLGAVPLRRSAASDLALVLGAEMHL